MATSTAIACTRPGAHRNGLAAHELRRIDHQDVGIGEMLVERLPGALEQQGVAGRQHDLARPLVLAAPLHRQDHEIAARRDHARKHRLPDQPRARRDHDLGEARRAVEQRVRDIAAALVRAEGEVLVGGQRAGRFRIAAHDQHVAFGDRGPPPRAAPIGGLDVDQGQARVAARGRPRRAAAPT